MKEFQKEITPLSSNDLFTVLNHPSAKFDYPVHYHSEYEINLVIGSYGKRIVGDCEEEFDSLDLVMIGPNVPHAWKSEIVEGNHVVTIQFSEEFLSYAILDKIVFRHIKNLLYVSKRGICFPKQISADVCDRILKLTKLQGFQAALEFLSILHQLAISDKRFLMYNQYDSQFIIRESKSRRITKVCDYIEMNYTKSVKSDDVALMVNMSPSAFSHFFKKKTRCTFIDYVINLRIAKACQILTETTCSITEICFACGFNNLSNFNRLFKKKKGMKPGEYRVMMEQMLIKY